MAHLLLSPLTALLVLVLVLAAGWHRLPRMLRWLGAAACAFALLLCAPLGANQLVRLAEAGLPASTRCDARAGAPVVVVSGGFDRKPIAYDDYAALGAESWRRLQAAVGLWRRAGGRLVIVGGGPYDIAESDVMAGLAMDWGVPVDAIVQEDRSLTTRENAAFLRDIWNDDTWKGSDAADIWLVSSSLHLPRAARSFIDAGFSPCAHSSGSDRVAPDGIGYFIPQASAIDKSRRALHELVGGIAYRVRGDGRAHAQASSDSKSS